MRRTIDTTWRSRTILRRAGLALAALVSLATAAGCLLSPATWSASRIDDPPWLSPYNRPLISPNPQPYLPTGPNPQIGAPGGYPAAPPQGESHLIPQQRLRVDPNPSGALPELGASGPFPDSSDAGATDSGERGADKPTPSTAPAELRPVEQKPMDSNDASKEPDGASRIPATTPDDGPRFGPPGAERASRIELTVKGPERCLVDDDVVYSITIANPSDDAASDVRVEVAFDEGFVFPGSSETRVDRTFDELAAGESKQFQLTLVAAKAGKQCCRFSVQEKGASSASKSVCVDVAARKLGVSVLGPSERFAGNRAEFNIKIVNSSQTAQKNVRLSAAYEPALKPVEWSNEAVHGDSRLSWKLGDFSPGEGVQIQIELECLRATEETCLTIDVSVDGEPSERTVACLRVAPADEPLAVEVEDADDPLAVGRETEYSIRVQNRGLLPARGVAVLATVPPLFEVVSLSATVDGKAAAEPTRDGRSISWKGHEPLSVDAVLLLRIRVKASGIGDDRLRATVTAEEMDDVTVVEPTTVNPSP